MYKTVSILSCAVFLLVVVVGGGGGGGSNRFETMKLAMKLRSYFKISRSVFIYLIPLIVIHQSHFLNSIYCHCINRAF